MVFARVDLFDDSTDSRTILSKKNKNIFDHKALFCILVNQLHVCQSLLIRANLIGAFHDKNTFTPQDTPRLTTGRKIQVQNRFVVLLVRPVPRTVIPVVALIVLVANMRGSARSMHVGRIKHHAID